MAKAREFKRRLRALGKTKQITKTMELVATSKMKKTQERVTAARPYTKPKCHVVEHIHMAKQCIVLKHESDAAFRGRPIRHVFLVEANPRAVNAVRRVQPCDDSQ